MEKVILTQEQAEAIENWANKGQLIVAKAAGLLEHGKDEPIDELTMEEIVKALYIGYEVEPEFKLNEWIYNIHNGKIFQMRKDDLEPANKPYNKKHFRHATPSEIAEEKERRWWKGLDREINEFRTGDVVYLGDCIYTVVEYASDYAIKDIDGDDWNVGEIKLVCPAENRLDVKTNE